MTPKERMLTTLNHEEPDRVPTGEWQFGREIVEPVLGPHTLMNSWAETQAYWAGRRDEVMHNWKTGLVALVRHYQWDAVLVHNVIGRETPIEVPMPLGDQRWQFANGDVLQFSAETNRFLIVERGGEGVAPVKATPDASDKSDDSARPQSPAAQDEPTDSELEVVRHVARELGRTHFLFSAPLLGHPQLRFTDATSGGQVEDWVRLYEDPDAFLEQQLRKFKTGTYRAGVETARREGMDGVAFSWDYGVTTGPMMSPDMFRNYVQPVVAATAQTIHDAGLVFLHHACGNNQVLMDLIVEAGVDIYQSIQPEMDIAGLKRRYGKRIALWGGVSSGLLVTGAPEDVRTEGARILKECKPGGGYVYSTSHSVMPGARHENYRAMLEALRAAGAYEKGMRGLPGAVL